jgi:hypothetical protein
MRHVFGCKVESLNSEQVIFCFRKHYKIYIDYKSRQWMLSLMKPIHENDVYYSKASQ